MPNTAKNNTLLNKEDLKEFSKYIKEEKLIEKTIANNLISILTNGVQSETQHEDVSQIMQYVEYTLHVRLRNKKLELEQELEQEIKQEGEEKINPSIKKYINLFAICSKIALNNVFSNDNTLSGKEELKNRLIQGSPSGYHSKIINAINTIYPEDGNIKAPIIASIQNITRIFGYDNIIDILRSRLKIVSYHEKDETNPDQQEISMLNSRPMKNYFTLRDRNQQTKYFTAGETSLRTLFDLFDIEMSSEMKQEIIEEKPKEKIFNNLKQSDKTIEEFEDRLTESLTDQNKFQEIKQAIITLKNKYKELQDDYNEEALNKIASLKQQTDKTTIIKSLLPAKNFLNRFKSQTLLPSYIQLILKKIQNLSNTSEAVKDEELVLLYLYFAQHQYITTSSIQTIIDNLKYLNIDLRLVKGTIKQEHINILDIIKIVDTCPDYYKEVEEKNTATINKVEEIYNLDTNQTLKDIWPIFLKSKNIMSKEYKDLYILYNTSLTFSEQKKIKALFKKRSFNITNYNTPLHTETVVENMKSIESIATLEETLKSLTLISRKIKYHTEQNSNNGIQNYRDNYENNKLSFKTILAEDKKAFKKEIKDGTSNTTKGQYILIEDLKTECKTPNCISELRQKIEDALILPEYKILRNFVYHGELAKLIDEEQSGIISGKSKSKLISISNKLEKFVTPKNLEEVKQKLVFPHIIETIPISKTQIQNHIYFHPKQIRQIQNIKEQIDRFSKDLLRRKADETLFMEHLMLIHENTDKVLLTPNSSFDTTVEVINPKNIETTKNDVLQTFEQQKVSRRYQNLLSYQSPKQQENLIKDFHNNKDTIQKLAETYNIATELKNINRVIQLRKNDENHLASPVIANYIQNLIYLATEQKDKIKDNTYKDSHGKEYFAARKRQKVYADFKTKEMLDQKVEETTQTIVKIIKEHTEKNKITRKLINGVTQGTGKGKNRKRTRNYDTSTNLRDRNINSFLGKKSLKAFLLGETETYEIPEYIKKNLKDDIHILKSNDYDIYQKKLKEIEKYINDNLIRL